MGVAIMGPDGYLGSMCDDSPNLKKTANAICRGLGYEYGNFKKSANAFGEAEGDIVLDDVRCLGSENSLNECFFRRPWGQNNCGHGEDLGVVCHNYSGNRVC